MSDDSEARYAQFLGGGGEMDTMWLL